MKALTILSIIIAFTIPSFGQDEEKNDPMRVLFEKAYNQLNDRLFSDAIKTYEHIIKTSSINSGSYGEATYYMGITYLLIGDTGEAKKIFLSILDTDLDDMDTGVIESWIIGEPYALYKHNACVKLAEIELNNKNYPESLEYIKLFDEEYPYHHFCGNEMADYAIYKAMMYAKVYTGMGDTMKAIKSTLPQIFESGLADNSRLVNFTVNLLNNKYDKTFLTDSFSNAVQHLAIITTKRTSKSSEFKTYQLNFLETVIYFPYFFDDEGVQSLTGYVEQPVTTATEKINKRKEFALKSYFFNLLSN